MKPTSIIYRQIGQQGVPQSVSYEKLTWVEIDKHIYRSVL